MVTTSRLMPPPLQESPKIESVDIKRIQRYYRWRWPFYDSSRWSYLFGRKAIAKKLPLNKEEVATIMEIGSGTGFNLKQILLAYPNVTLYGMDLSRPMIRVARMKLLRFINRIRLIHDTYPELKEHRFNALDGIIFSYTLSMAGENWKELVLQAKKDLKPGGWIAVVDYHNSGFGSIKKYFANRHVKVDNELLNFLRAHFQIKEEEVLPAYSGLWSYFLFVGKTDRINAK